MNPYTDWKAKLERAHFFKVRSDRITVCWADWGLLLKENTRENDWAGLN